MLVLQLLPGERIIVGDRAIVIELVRVRGDKVRIGIEAPKSVSVHREEIFEQIKRETDRK